MKKIGFFTLMFLLSGLLFGQDFDNIVTRKLIDCSDISHNSGLYFVKYMQENKLDSAQYLLQYWEGKCGMREPIFRAKILLALKQDQYHDSLLSKGALNHIHNYQRRMEMIKHSSYYSYDYSKSYYGFIPPGQEFDKYTQELSKTLIGKYEPNQTEYLLAEFYGENSDTIFSKIQTKTFENNPLTIEYESVVSRYVKLAEFHGSWLTGVWIPTGKLSTLGVHPEMGFQAGAKHKKMNYDIVMAFKFLKSPNYYYARRTELTDSLEMTNNFFGGYMGFEVGRDIFSRNGHEFQLMGGVAFDGFDVLKEDKEKELKNASANALNLNIGLEYRYYMTNSSYLGLRAKYNFVDYSKSKVIDLTGNVVTVHFIIGGVDNVFRNYNLEALEYKMRK